MTTVKNFLLFLKETFTNDINKPEFEELIVRNIQLIKGGITAEVSVYKELKKVLKLSGSFFFCPGSKTDTKKGEDFVLAKDGKKAVFQVKPMWYVSKYGNITEFRVRKYLDEIKSDSITVTYEGGGDSGFIETNYESSNGGGSIPAVIENICYSLLEEFGGWEINEGSQGSIILSRDEIEVEHEWNVQEEHWEEANIVITPETFNE